MLQHFNFYDAWYSGLTDAEIWEELGMPVNHGFCEVVCFGKERK